MVDLQIEHHFSGREYARKMVLPAGHKADTHRHNFDHLSILASGIARVTVDGETTLHIGPECLTIRAGAVHYIEAVTGIVWYCIHATDETDPARIDHELIKES
jgi:quercetin dioxygenase-like cupin family protein